jgi:phosphocarrier protein HPr
MVAALPDGLSVTVAKDGTEAAGGSILGLMMLGAARGETIEIRVRGEEADVALARLCGLVKDGFGED